MVDWTHLKLSNKLGATILHNSLWCWMNKSKFFNTKCGVIVWFNNVNDDECDLFMNKLLSVVKFNVSLLKYKFFVDPNKFLNACGFLFDEANGDVVDAPARVELVLQILPPPPQPPPLEPTLPPILRLPATLKFVPGVITLPDRPVDDELVVLSVSKSVVKDIDDFISSNEKSKHGITRHVGIAWNNHVMRMKLKINEDIHSLLHIWMYSKCKILRISVYMMHMYGI